MRIIVVSDFDGTITKKDSLYYFFDEYADKKWLEVEKLWKDGKISSKECLIKEFELVKNLDEKLIDKFISTIEIDDYFSEFIKFCKNKNIDFTVASDGVDYFINKILQKNNIAKIDLVTNHGEFINGKFTLTFPNDFKDCKNDSGTCKCRVVWDLKKKYDKVIYIGDGTSDFCVSKNADFLIAKSGLVEYCKINKINHTPFNSFKDVVSILNQFLQI